MKDSSVKDVTVLSLSDTALSRPLLYYFVLFLSSCLKKVLNTWSWGWRRVFRANRSWSVCNRNKNKGTEMFHLPGAELDHRLQGMKWHSQCLRTTREQGPQKTPHQGSLESSVVEHTAIPARRRLRQEDHEFEASPRLQSETLSQSK
jgi:hypothetical protein